MGLQAFKIGISGWRALRLTKTKTGKRSYIVCVAQIASMQDCDLLILDERLSQLLNLAICKREHEAISPPVFIDRNVLLRECSKTGHTKSLR